MSNTIGLSGNNLLITSNTTYIGNSGSSYAFFSGDSSTSLTVPGSLSSNYISLDSGQIYGSSTYGVSINNLTSTASFTVTDNLGGTFQFNPTTGNIYLTGGSSSSDSIAITAFDTNFVLSSYNNIQMKTGGDTTWLYFYPNSANIRGTNTNSNASLYLTCDSSQNTFVGINNYGNNDRFLKIIPNSLANTSGINNLVELDAAGSDLALTCQDDGNIYFGNDTQDTSSFPMYLNTSNSSLYITGSVYGSSSDTASFNLFNSGINNGIQFNPGTANTGEVIMYANCDNFVLMSSNNIQMKTGSPTNNIGAVFNFYPSAGSMTVSGSNTLIINNNVNAYSFNTTSDYRIKSNIEEISSTYIDKLRPVTYTNNKNNKKEFGLIAHELQEHYPELVTGEKDSEKMQSINYIGVIPLLITEIQRLNSLTEKLTNEVERLKKML